MTATTRRRFHLPAPYKPLKDVQDTGVVLHAALNCRALQTFLALALARRGDSAIITPRTEAARFLLDRLLGGVRHQRSVSKRVQRREAGATRVWVLPPDVDYDDLPFFSLESYAVDGAHLFEQDPGVRLDPITGGARLYAGELPLPGSWFRDLIEREDLDELIRINADEACRLWPRERTKRIPEGEPGHSRLMLLEDDEEELEAGPPLRFLRQRIHVKTDKGRAFLSERQQAVAARDLGPAWDSGAVGVPVVPYEPTRMQRRYLAMKRAARRRGYRKFLLLKYRRGGFTTTEQADSYRIVATRPRAEVATLAHDLESTQRIFRMVKLMHERDPRAVRPLGDSRRVLQLETGATFFVGTAGGRGFSRGDTIQKAHGSEVSRWCLGPRQMELVSDLVSGLVGAASHGEVVLETTPNGVEWFCRTYREARRELAREKSQAERSGDWYPIFLPWFSDPTNVAEAGTFDPEEIRETLNEEERDLVEKFQLRPEQIAFRRAMKREHGRLFPQEYPEDEESCFITTGSPWFDIPRLQALKRALPFEEHGEVRNVPGGKEIIWKAPVKGGEYVAGVDTSEGLPGRDPNGIGVLDRATGEQVYSLHGLFNVNQLADHVIRVALLYNQALTGIERENHGHAVIKGVIDQGHGASHLQGGWLFYHPRPRHIHDPANPSNPDGSARAGWSTNPVTRPVALQKLADMVMDGSLVVNDRLFLDEALSFRLQSNGRYEADPGAHDDSVLKWTIAGAMLDHRKASVGISFL